MPSLHEHFLASASTFCDAVIKDTNKRANKQQSMTSRTRFSTMKRRGNHVLGNTQITTSYLLFDYDVNTRPSRLSA